MRTAFAIQLEMKNFGFYVLPNKSHTDVTSPKKAKLEGMTSSIEKKGRINWISISNVMRPASGFNRVYV